MMLSTFGDDDKPSTLHEASALCRSMSVSRWATSNLHGDCLAERRRFEADLSMCPAALVWPLGVLTAGAENCRFSIAGLRGMLRSGLSRQGLHIRSAALKLSCTASRMSPSARMSCPSKK